MNTVNIQGVGTVTFPAEMSPAQIQAVIEKEILPQAGALNAAPSKTEAPGLLQGATQSFGRGASFGLSDRLGALASDVLGYGQSAGEYGNFGGTYSDNLSSIQDNRDRFAEAHPGVDFAANLAGGIVSTVPAISALSKAEQLANAVRVFRALPTTAQYAAGGAGFGALAGAGNAREGHVLGDAATGGAVGGVLGPILPPVVKYGVKAADALVGTPVRAVVNAFRTPEEQGTRLLAKALARDQTTPEQLQATLNQLGPNAIVADAAGKNTLGLADLALTQPGIAQNQGLNFLEQRAQGAGGRVNQALRNSLGVDSTNVDDLTQALHQNMRNVAEAHGYDDILNAGRVDLTPEIERMMQAPIMRDALSTARTITRNDIGLGRANSTAEQFFRELPSGEVVLEPQFINGAYELRPASSPVPWSARGVVQPPEETVGEVASRPTLRVWDYVKRGLDSIVRDETDPITGKMTSRGETAAAYRRNLLESIDRQNPDYAAVRSAYADEKAGENALNLGRAFMSDDSEVTARRLADMTPAEQKYFKAGAARRVQDMIGNRPDTGMAYADFLKRPNYVEKLRAAFGNDQAGFDGFMQQLRNEKVMGDTAAAAGKNSRTAARVAAAQDAGTPLTGSSIPTSKLELLKSGLNYVTRPSEETSSQLARLLFSPDPASRQRAIDALLQLDQKMNRPVLGMTPRNAQLANALTARQASQDSNQ